MRGGLGEFTGVAVNRSVCLPECRCVSARCTVVPLTIVSNVMLIFGTTSLHIAESHEHHVRVAYSRMCLCVYVCMYVCMHSLHGWYAFYACYACDDCFVCYACIRACTYVCTHVRMSACIYVCTLHACGICKLRSSIRSLHETDWQVPL